MGRVRKKALSKGERFCIGSWKDAAEKRLAGLRRPGVFGVWLTLRRALATALTFFLPVWEHTDQHMDWYADQTGNHLVVQIFGPPFRNQVLFELSTIFQLVCAQGATDDAGECAHLANFMAASQMVRNDYNGHGGRLGREMLSQTAS